MKQLFIITLIILLIFTTYLLAGAENDLKDISTLKIYIDGHEYGAEKFLEESGMVYTGLESLSEALNVKCSAYKSETGYDVLYKLWRQYYTLQIRSHIKK